MSLRNTIVIVGGGFSGTVLAANLLRRPPEAVTEIVLIERAAAVGRGVAYAANPHEFLLNVPAARLSADSREPLQFLQFARRSLPHADSEDFLPRALYGEYLQELLRTAEGAAPARVHLRRVHDTVRRVSRSDGALTVELARGGGIAAHMVVLATGNPPPPELPFARQLRAHPGYWNDPWDLPEDGPAPQAVLIVGTGLTMADLACALCAPPGRVPAIHAISRHGLLPRSETVFGSTVLPGAAAALAGAHSIRRLLEVSRTLAREVQARGGDWREVVTVLRNAAPSIWRRLAQPERLRFMRHLQTYWDVHRHRLPPTLAERIATLRSSGHLQINAGRVERLEPAADRIDVFWRPRAAADTRVLRVDAVINATGPNYAVPTSRDPLIGSLAADGLIAADGLNLGLRTAEHGACIDVDGVPAKNLFYLGPMLRAAWWEATAVTELRNHAENLAEFLAGGAAQV